MSAPFAPHPAAAVPLATEAEQVIVGCAIKHPLLRASIADIVRPRWFADSVHVAIMAWAIGLPDDASHAAGNLAQHITPEVEATCEQVGGTAYIAQLAASAPDTIGGLFPAMRRVFAAWQDRVLFGWQALDPDIGRPAVASELEAMELLLRGKPPGYQVHILPPEYMKAMDAAGDWFKAREAWAACGPHRANYGNLPGEAVVALDRLTEAGNALYLAMGGQEG